MRLYRLLSAVALAGYAPYALIRSLSYPLQVLVRNQRLDLSPYIERLLVPPGAGRPSTPTWFALASSLADLLRRIAAERTQSIRLRDALLVGITHDLRNPLTVIRIEARLLSRALAASYIDSVVHIERSAIRAARSDDAS